VAEDDADHVKAFGFVLVLELNEMGDLHAAWGAPGIPEINDHDLALVIGQFDGLAIRARQFKGGGTLEAG